MTIANTIALIRQGIDYALDDYCRLAEKPLGVDVKPKEDQLKCALYRAFTEAEHVVHVEGGYERNGPECDLMVAMRRPVGIEIKTAWAATGWNNKVPEQADTWHKDLDKLKTLPAKGFGTGFFVMMFAICRRHRGRGNASGGDCRSREAGHSHGAEGAHPLERAGQPRMLCMESLLK